jgi:hypothetical protein
VILELQQHRGFGSGGRAGGSRRCGQGAIDGLQSLQLGDGGPGWSSGPGLLQRQQDATRGDETLNGTSSNSPRRWGTARDGGQAGWRWGGARGSGSVRWTSDPPRADPDPGRPPGRACPTAMAAASMPSRSGTRRPLWLGCRTGGRSAGTRSGGAAGSTPGTERLTANRSAEPPTAEEAGPPAHSDASTMASTRNALVVGCCRSVRMAVRPYWIPWQTPRWERQPAGDGRGVGRRPPRRPAVVGC